MACAVVAEPAPEGDGAAAIARAPPPGTDAR